MEKSEEDNAAENSVCFGHLCALLKRVEDGIFRELCASHDMIGVSKSAVDAKTTIWDCTNLLIELLDVIASLVRCLNEGRMFLHFLRSRHLLSKRKEL